MVGTSGQARVGGIGRFGDQYHHGVVGGAMSRIPEHQVGWLEMDLSHKVGLNFFLNFQLNTLNFYQNILNLMIFLFRLNMILLL